MGPSRSDQFELEESSEEAHFTSLLKFHEALLPKKVIWVIAYFLLGGLIFLGLGVWASLLRKVSSSDGFLLGIADLFLLAIWPLAVPLMLKEMFSEAPAIPSEPKPLVARDSMIGSAGIASTDLSPSGKITIEGQLFEAIAILGVIARGTKVEVVDRDDLRVRVRVWPS